MNPSAQRLADRPGLVTSINWDPWVDLPESVMARFPDLREWNHRLRLRDEANRQKIDDELSRLQKAIDT
jgi:hypothetical protein